MLPGFQFRIDDLYQKPSLDEMVKDTVYKNFVLPGYSEALQKLEVEECVRKEAEQHAEKLAEKLRALGIDPDKL